jgi:hypothetical protein
VSRFAKEATSFSTTSTGEAALKESISDRAAKNFMVSYQGTICNSSDSKCANAALARCWRDTGEDDPGSVANKPAFISKQQFQILNLVLDTDSVFKHEYERKSKN